MLRDYPRRVPERRFTPAWLALALAAAAPAQRQLAPIRRHHVSYDAATRHGATQGARFP